MIAATLRACALAAPVFLLAGCNAAVEQQPSAAPKTQAPIATPGPPVSINALMVAWVDHAAHALWDVERDAKAPKSDAEWADVEHHATQLAAAGTLTALGGTGVHDKTNRDSPDWQKWSTAMSDAGLAALKASHDKDRTALVAANGQLVDACNSCHQEFKPQIPSEGLMHTHTHEPPAAR